MVPHIVEVHIVWTPGSFATQPLGKVRVESALRAPLVMYREIGALFVLVAIAGFTVNSELVRP